MILHAIDAILIMFATRARTCSSPSSSPSFRVLVRIELVEHALGRGVRGAVEVLLLALVELLLAGRAGGERGPDLGLDLDDQLRGHRRVRDRTRRRSRHRADAFTGTMKFSDSGNGHRARRRPARLVTTLIQWSSAWPANACAGAVDGLMSRGRVAARGGARGGGAVTYVGQDLGHAPGPAFAAGPPLHPEGAAGPVVARLVLVVVLVRRHGVCAALASTTAAADRSALCDFFESQTATFGRFFLRWSGRRRGMARETWESGF